MPTITIPNTFTANTTIASADVNSNFNTVATFLNSTGIDDTNVQAAGISGTKLKTNVADGTTIALTSGVLGVVDGSITLAKLAATLQTFLMPTGSIVAFGGTTIPTGFLLCDGTSYLRATYNDLYGIIGSFWGSADGTHFNVPDLRGRFPRGSDDMGSGAAGRDPNAGTRTASATGGSAGNHVGSAQADAFKSHTHGPGSLVVIRNDTTNNQGATGVASGAGATGLLDNVFGGTQLIVAGLTDATGGSETRPINAYVNYIIKT